MRAGRLTRVALAALLAVGGTASAKDRLPPFPQGLYGDVALGEESGDLGGFEVRFFVDEAGRRMAEFTLCEGWCNIAYTAEVTREGEGFVFGHVEVLESSNGTREEHRVGYRVVPRGRALLVTYIYDGEPFNAAAPWRIAPRRKPFGLTVARGEEGQGRP
ncbi:hypothetical protein ACLBKU_10820 [Erythrobacter sp. NE805]|uniref:hypothetical protein n=1 Tax=Erythrobacter sp. NE805 TaxID=3389875 RepID=UPI00396B28AF